MSRRLAAIAVATTFVATACVNNSPGDLSDSAAKVLRPAVEDVRQAAADGSFADLRDAVQRLKDLVGQEERAGDVSSQRATAIEDAADVLLQDARPTPSPTPSFSPTPTETSESPTPTPTSASPTPSQTSASPSPTTTHSPVVSVSAVAQSTQHRPSSSSPRPSSSPSSSP